MEILKPGALALAVMAAVLVSGCGHTPVTSIYKLSKIDAHTTDLKELRTAVQIPIGFEPTDDSVAMVATLEKSKSNPALIETFWLEKIPMTAREAGLADYQSGTRRFFFFRITPDDVPRFDRFRDLQIQSKANEERKGSLSISANVCRRSAQLPDIVKISTFIKTSETREFVPLLLDMDLLEEASSDDIQRVVPPCQ